MSGNLTPAKGARGEQVALPPPSSRTGGLWDTFFGHCFVHLGNLSHDPHSCSHSELQVGAHADRCMRGRWSSFLVPDWSKANEPPYKLAAVERRPIISTVAAAGTINPIKTIIVGSQLSGQIVEISR